VQIIGILNQKQNKDLVMTNCLKNVYLAMKHKKGFNNILAKQR